MYNAEQLMEDIQNIAKSLDINSIKILYSINEKEEFIYSSEIYVRVYGNPSNIKYDEYKKLENFCAKNSLKPRDFRNVVFCSMDISPYKAVKSIKGTKGERLRPIIKRLEKSDYTLDI